MNKVKLNMDSIQLLREGYVATFGDDIEQWLWFPFWYKRTDEEDVYESYLPREVPDHVREFFPELFGKKPFSMSDLDTTTYTGKLLIAAIAKIMRCSEPKEGSMTSDDILMELKEFVEQYMVSTWKLNQDETTKN